MGGRDLPYRFQSFGSSGPPESPLSQCDKDFFWGGRERWPKRVEQAAREEWVGSEEWSGLLEDVAGLGRGRYGCNEEHWAQVLEWGRVLGAAGEQPTLMIMSGKWRDGYIWI